MDFVNNGLYRQSRHGCLIRYASVALSVESTLALVAVFLLGYGMPYLLFTAPAALAVALFASGRMAEGSGSRLALLTALNCAIPLLLWLGR